MSLIFRDSCHLSPFHLLPFAVCMGDFDLHRTHCPTFQKSIQDNLKKPENPSVVANETNREVCVVSIHAQQVLYSSSYVVQPNWKPGLLTNLYIPVFCMSALAHTLYVDLLTSQLKVSDGVVETREKISSGFEE